MTRKKEDAVSPVIGVMLMLVVTVVIAAVIAVFATGMMEDTEPAPVAKLDVKIYSKYLVKGGEWSDDSYIPDLHVTHVSGDPVDTQDLKFTFSWEDPYGDSHFSTFEYREEGWYDELMGAGIWPPSGYAGSNQPLAINYGNTGGANFGAFTLERGQTMTALTVFQMQPWGPTMYPFVNNANPALDVILNNGEVFPVTYAEICPSCGSDNDPSSSMCYVCWMSVPFGSYGIMEYLPPGTTVDVSIVHKPSNKLIYKDEVMVQ